MGSVGPMAVLNQAIRRRQRSGAPRTRISRAAAGLARTLASVPSRAEIVELRWSQNVARGARRTNADDDVHWRSTKMRMQDIIGLQRRVASGADNAGAPNTSRRHHNAPRPNRLISIQAVRENSVASRRLGISH